MATLEKNIAVVVFSRNEEEESIHKPIFSPGKKSANKALAKCFISKVRQTAHKSGLPVIWHNSFCQIGTSFGEKLANALESTFAQGYDKLIVVGNDCLSLSHQDIQQAARCLSDVDFVFGPRPDGGIYLLGLTRDAFCKEELLKIRWCTHEVFERLKCLGSAMGKSTLILSEKRDINNFEDLLLVIKTRLLPVNLKARLSALVLSLHKKKSTCFCNKSAIALVRSISLRAPPMLPPFKKAKRSNLNLVH